MFKIKITKSESDLLREAITYYAKEVLHLHWKVDSHGSIRVDEDEVHKMIDALQEYKNNIKVNKRVLKELLEKLFNFI